MKKLLPYIALIPLVIMALTPPWTINWTCDINSLAWLWAVLISGFLTFAYLYQDVSTWVKLFLIYAFASCFLSRAPYISFTMFWTLVGCAYYYALCRKITDWKPVIRTYQSLFFLCLMLLFFQLINKDSLLNFNMSSIGIMGTIGNRMIFSSFICCLAPFLIINPLNIIPLWLCSLISWSSGAILALMMGTIVLVWCNTRRARVVLISIIILLPFFFALYTGDINVFKGKAGRRLVWQKGIELTMKRPLGYGIGTWKVLFPYMCGAEIRDQQPGREWNTAHNDFVQIPFEVGIPGTFLLAGWAVSLLRKVREPLKLAGLMILVGTMTVHFPARLCQTVLMILMFLAYLEGEPCNTSS